MSNTNRKYVGASHRALYVTLAVVLLSMIPGIFISGLKPLAYIATLVYISGEHKRRGHSWEEIGIKLRGFKEDFRANWYLILIVAVVLQLPIPLIARAYWPDLLRHMSDRIPLLNSSSIGSVNLGTTSNTLFRRIDISWVASTTISLVPKWVPSHCNCFIHIWAAAFHLRLTCYRSGRPGWSIC